MNQPNPRILHQDENRSIQQLMKGKSVGKSFWVEVIQDFITYLSKWIAKGIDRSSLLGRVKLYVSADGKFYPVCIPASPEVITIGPGFLIA